MKILPEGGLNKAPIQLKHNGVQSKKVEHSHKSWGQNLEKDSSIHMRFLVISIFKKSLFHHI